MFFYNNFTLAQEEKRKARKASVLDWIISINRICERIDIKVLKRRFLSFFDIIAKETFDKDLNSLIYRRSVVQEESCIYCNLEFVTARIFSIMKFFKAP